MGLPTIFERGLIRDAERLPKPRGFIRRSRFPKPEIKRPPKRDFLHRRVPYRAGIRRPPRPPHIRFPQKSVREFPKIISKIREHPRMLREEVPVRGRVSKKVSVVRHVPKEIRTSKISKNLSREKIPNEKSVLNEEKILRNESNLGEKFPKENASGWKHKLRSWSDALGALGNALFLGYLGYEILGGGNAENSEDDGYDDYGYGDDDYEDDGYGDYGYGDAGYGSGDYGYGDAGYDDYGYGGYDGTIGYGDDSGYNGYDNYGYGTDGYQDYGSDAGYGTDGTDDNLDSDMEDNSQDNPYNGGLLDNLNSGVEELSSQTGIPKELIYGGGVAIAIGGLYYYLKKKKKT